MRTNLLWLILLLAPLSLSIISCDNNDDDDVTIDVMAELRADARFSTLVSALDQTNLDAVVSSLDGMTIFAPTNDAFTALGVDLSTLSDQELSDILLYHVLAARVESSDLASGQTYASTALAGPDSDDPGVSILIEVDSGVRINNTADVIEADIDADNGVIHAIDAVLLPLDVVGQAMANENFSELVGALGAASGNLVDVLQGDGPFTVFAPVNTAFEEIADVASGLTADQLAAVLTYHVVAGANILSNDLSDGQVVNTVNTATFTVNIGSSVTITDEQGGEATVILTDVQGTNGAIHVIDKVLLPQL